MGGVVLLVAGAALLVWALAVPRSALLVRQGAKAGAIGLVVAGTALSVRRGSRDKDHG
ncbi:hypothetical protein [Streptomyces sp. NPDC093094]|uniref:hypothetical protein n=1 Tax=Streptomyces sp. NPDC093094 TaxID=3366026 RepID=UPI00381A3657